MALVLAGLRKQFIKKNVFPTWACAAGLVIIIIIIIIIIITALWPVEHKSHARDLCSSPM